MNSTNEWLQDISNIAQKFQTNDQNQFRALTSAEIDLLVANGNSSSNWSFISIPTDVEDVYFPNIRNCRFEGRILLIGFTSLSLISIGKGVSLCSGLFNSTFTGTCIVGKDCTVRDCQCINNTFIAHQAAIIGCGIISYITNNSHFGNDTLVSVGPSTGGRYVNLHALESFVNLAKRSLEPHQGSYVDLSVERLQYNELLSSLSCTVIGGHAIITRCDEIMNSIIGPCTQISQTKNISDCTFFSSHSHPVVVKRASDLRRVIMLHNTLAGDECRVRDVQMFEHSSISGGALVEESVLAPDASVGGGECLHAIVGPHIGFHHSCLLISSVWPFGRGNLSYGCKVGANHTGRVSDQENHPGEGCFFGLGVEIKFPSNTLASPYTLFASGVTCLPQILTFPFSLIAAPETCGCQLNVSPAYNSLKPGWVLYGNPYMLIRATQKFSKRRKAEFHSTDFPVMRQSIVEMMMKAREDLKNLLSSCKTVPSSLDKEHQPSDERVYTEKDCPGIGKNVLLHGDVLKGYHAYDEAIKSFVVEKGFFEYLRARRRHDQSCNTDTSISAVLKDIKCFLEGKTPHPVSRHPHSLQYSVLADLHLFDPNFSSSSDNLTHVGETLVTKQTAWALSHFYVEFPHALSLPIPLPSHSNASLPSPSSSTNRDLLQSYLHYLMILHQKQYDTAQRCRKSDSIRGRKIISDYDEVHPSVESDEVLSSLRGEVEMLRTELTSLLNDLLD